MSILHRAGGPVREFIRFTLDGAIKKERELGVGNDLTAPHNGLTLLVGADHGLDGLGPAEADPSRERVADVAL